MYKFVSCLRNFKQAYDSINRLQLCIIMREIGTPTKTANLSKLVLRKTMNKMQIGGTLADSFDTTNVLSQRDSLSTLLLN